MIRVKCLFAGHVQGIGFRYTAQRISVRYEVAGYVKNLPDARVEVVAEGAEEAVRAFLAEIRQTMSGCISSCDKTCSDCQNEFSRFEVRF